LSHWLTRQEEKHYYFADPEEIMSFALSMAYQLLKGKNKKDLYIIFFPIIIKHFNDEKNAEKLFNALFVKALAKVKEFKSELV